MFTAVAMLAGVACGSDSAGPESATATGTWELNALLVGASNLTCQWSRVRLTLTQSGENLSGTHSGGSRTCLLDTRRSVEDLPDGSITGGRVTGADVRFSFRGFTVAGTIRTDAMGGTMFGDFTAEDFDVTDRLAGDWTAER